MNKVMQFAREELDGYFYRLTGKPNDIALEKTKTSAGLFDERFIIDVDKTHGKICGVNERSVLLGVYRFLREVGCRFLYPGADGEIIPRISSDEISVHIDVVPAHRHRGLTLEGGCSCEHVKNLIDWGFKNGFNSYFIQFRTGYTFFERWYRHDFNPFAEKEPFNDETAEKINAELRAEIKKRGMIFHAVGHGWTCEPFGIPSRGWDESEKVPEKYRRYFALVNGERGFYKGVPLNTNLCYSYAAARKAVVENVAEYAAENKDADVIHLWLGDNYNNFCECEECAKKLPSEWYVELLNELDARLTELKIDVKIVFLIYFELLYKPLKEKFKNSDRFIMMFAPITRTYDRSLADFVEEAKTKTVTPFTLNKFVPPVDCAENIRHLYDWQEVFSGDSFIFDYPLMWDCCREYGGIILAKTIYNDIRALKSLNLNGYISCQLQRNFFPTGFPMYVMATALADESRSYEDINYEYFSAAFGIHGSEVYDILSDVSSWKIYDYMRGNIETNSPEMRDAAGAIKLKIKAYSERVAEMERENNAPVIMRHLALVDKLFGILSLVTDIIEEKTGNNDESKIDLILRKLQIDIFVFEPFCDQRFNGGYFYTHIEEMAHRQ